MEIADVSTRIGNITFKTCVWNAAGPRCTTAHELCELRDCQSAGAIVTKSCTLNLREGNAFPRVYSATDSRGGTISVNSVGLANLGIDKYLEFIREQRLSGHPKPIFLSIGGLSLAENKDLLTKIRLSDFKPDFIELNLSCPNIEGSGIVGYDYEAFKQYLNTLTIQTNLMKKTCPIGCGVKLPPYFNTRDFDNIAGILNMFENEIDFATTINGVPGGLVIDTETERSVIKPKGGMGGMGGSLTKPVGLSNVAQLRKRLSPKIDIIGVGGICSGEDIFEYLLCGATAVEVATQFLIEGSECFERMMTQLKYLMERKGYNTLEDFRGKFLCNCD